MRHGFFYSKFFESCIILFSSFLGGDSYCLSSGREHGGFQEEEAGVPRIPTRCKEGLHDYQFIS